MKDRILKVGTRRSALALKQTELVVAELQKQNPSLQIEVVELNTTGDIRRDKLNLQVQDKKQWIIELEKAIVGGEIDFAVHSGKDVPLNLEPGTCIQSVLKREDARDVIIYRADEGSSADIYPFLKPGALVGTSSKRRKAQILRLRPDLSVTPCRGNITTRIEKVLELKQYDAIIIGQAGLNRLSLGGGFQRIASELEIVPAVCQGTLVVQSREGDEEVLRILKQIQDPNSEQCFLAERNVIESLGADCHSSLGVFAEIRNDNMHIICRVCCSSGYESVESSISGSSNGFIELSQSLASEMVEKGALRML